MGKDGAAKRINSRQKGKRAENEAARILRAYGYGARRGQQYSGADGTADVEGLPGLHLEVKMREKLNVDKALEQSIRDSYADGLKQGRPLAPVVLHRSNDDRKEGSTRGKWKATMLLKDFMKLYMAWEEGEGLTK